MYILVSETENKQIQNMSEDSFKEQQSRVRDRGLFVMGSQGKPLQNEGMEQAIWKTRGRTFQAVETAGAKALSYNYVFKE